MIGIICESLGLAFIFNWMLKTTKPGLIDYPGSLFLYGMVMFFTLVVAATALSCNVDFGRDVNDLQQAFFGNGWANGRHSYYLNLPLEKLKQMATLILSNWAQTLTSLEKSKGKEDKFVNEVRMQFKSLHAIFVKFGLCEEDQRVWFQNEPQKPKEPDVYEYVGASKA